MKLTVDIVLQAFSERRFTIIHCFMTNLANRCAGSTPTTNAKVLNKGVVQCVALVHFGNDAQLLLHKILLAA